MYSLNVIFPQHRVIAHRVNILHDHLLQHCLIDVRSCVQDGLLLSFVSTEAHALACLEMFYVSPRSLARSNACDFGRSPETHVSILWVVRRLVPLVPDM